MSSFNLLSALVVQLLIPRQVCSLFRMALAMLSLLLSAASIFQAIFSLPSAVFIRRSVSLPLRLSAAAEVVCHCRTTESREWADSRGDELLFTGLV